MEAVVFQPKFIKPFSRGQITLPKNYRDYLGIDENSWLKVSLWNNQILLQPVKDLQKQRVIKPRVSLEDYLKILPDIKGSFGPELEKENKKIRKEVEERLKKFQF